MTLNDIFRIVQDTQHGSSGRGISYWAKAASCGRKANLEEAAGPREARVEGMDDDPDALMVGTYYHQLHEMKIRGQTSDLVWDGQNEAFTPSFTEAVRLFRGYMDHWGSVGARWGGHVVGTEVGIPQTDAGRAKIRKLFGDDVTGRVDALVEVTDPAQVYENTGLTLEPGLYLLDFKSLKSHSEQHRWSYGFSLQAATYLEIYNLEHPEAPAKGMLFDCIFKHKALRKIPDAKGGSSFQAYLQAPNPSDPQVIEALVTLGKRNVSEDIANPAECLSGFSPCFWFRSGKCPRY